MPNHITNSPPPLGSPHCLFLTEGTWYRISSLMHGGGGASPTHTHTTSHCLTQPLIYGEKHDYIAGAL